MSKNNNFVAKTLGLALVAITIGLACWSCQISDDLTVQLASTLSGKLPAELIYLYIGGAACGVAGLVLVVKG